MLPMWWWRCSATVSPAEPAEREQTEMRGGVAKADHRLPEPAGCELAWMESNPMVGDGVVKADPSLAGPAGCGLTEGRMKADPSTELTRGRLMYTFYEKEVATKFVILKNSALAENTKVSSLTQDLVRRMKNTSEYVNQTTRNKVVDDFSAKLQLSGYQLDQIKKIVIAGLKGYEGILRRVREGKAILHKSAKDGAKARYRKKLLGKSTWFKEKDRKDGASKDPNNTDATNIGRSDGRNVKPSPSYSKAAGNKTPASNVLFVPQTPGGALASALRQAEAELQMLCGGKVKIVERGGHNHQTNPPPNQPMGRRNMWQGKLPPLQKQRGREAKLYTGRNVYNVRKLAMRNCTLARAQGQVSKGGEST